MIFGRVGHLFYTIVICIYIIEITRQENVN